MKRSFILGTDWWTDCDDAVAIRILARAHRKKEINLLGVVINACMEYSVPSLDGFLQTEGVSIPIGLDASATDFGGKPPYQKNLVKFAKKYLKNEDAEDAVKLYRRLLASAEEKIEIIEIGYLQAIAALLMSEPDEISPLSGLELFKEKVEKMWVMAGKWDEPNGRENNFARNSRAANGAHHFVKLCPVPITFLGFEVGEDIISGSNLEGDDVLFNILKDHGSFNGRSSWDPMTVELAIIGDEFSAGYDVCKGIASVDLDFGVNSFVESPIGVHSFVKRKLEKTVYENRINACIK